jgi:molecular chaperone HscA
VESSIQVKPSYGLSESEVETMLRDSLDHAKDDVQVRNLREQQVEADRLLENLDSALEADGETLLSGEERAAIDGAMTALRAARAGSDHRQIKRRMEELDRVTAEFAARRMDASIRRALQGHKLEEFAGG